MGWFNKKEEKKEQVSQLPELPTLPDFPTVNESVKDDSKIQHSQLPIFPTNSVGEKFSQNIIKEAVTGEKEGENASEKNEFEEEEVFGGHSQKQSVKEIPFSETEDFQTEKIPYEHEKETSKNPEPIFIRIDKFEESLNLFEKTKKQIFEIEKMVENTKKIKEEEEKELEFWKNEMNSIKGQIAKIDKELFSKIE